jgi:FkbM family methyltransferase
MRRFMLSLKHFRSELGLLALKVRSRFQEPGSIVPCGEFRVEINDARNFYVLYKDVFVRRIYHFDAARSDPFILDCGSNIGVSILYYKHLYPKARVVGFEPDALVFPYLEGNMERNKIVGIRLVQAALSSNEGLVEFFSDGKFGSSLTEQVAAGGESGWTQSQVSSVRLRNYLNEPVDFLKMNIEGAEYEVLKDSEEMLHRVKEMVIEYHHLPGLPRTLHKILEILDRQGFEYLINDFDAETNGSVAPPFRLASESRYFLLIYAKKLA